MNIAVTRLWQAPQTSEYRATTTGVVSLDGAQNCFSLEPTELMIPAGVYTVKLQFSERFERHTPWLIVPGRTAIEMHGGNVATDSDGCILVADNKLSVYEIQNSPPATTAIENALRAAELRGEESTCVVVDTPIAA